MKTLRTDPGALGYTNSCRKSVAMAKPCLCGNHIQSPEVINMSLTVSCPVQTKHRTEQLCTTGYRLDVYVKARHEFQVI